MEINVGEVAYCPNLLSGRGVFKLYISSGRKDGSKQPVINLKNLNEFVPYQHFEMESLHCLNFLLQKDDYVCKIDLKYAYFSVPLHRDSQKLVTFQWKRSLLCFYFVL